MRITGIIWLFIIFFIGLFYEIFQKFSIINGTFDPIDLFFIIFGTTLPLLFTIKKKQNDKKN